MRKIIFGLVLAFVLSMTLVAAGYNNDTSENVTITVDITNSAPTITSIDFDDTDNSDGGTYIDLTPNTTGLVVCWAIVSDADGDSDISSGNATLYNVSNGYLGQQDNSVRYVNKTCNVNTAYGTALEANVSCTFKPLFYADNGTWNCNVTAVDSASNEVGSIDDTQSVVRKLLAMDYDNSTALDFGSLAIGGNTATTDYNLSIYNIGNTRFDVILETYSASRSDGTSMTCTGGTLDDSDLKYSLADNTAYASKTTVPSDGTGSTASAFDLDRQTSGTTATKKSDVAFGFGIQSSETGRSGTCTGRIMVTALEG